VNLGETERYASIIGGVALVATGLSRRSLPGLILAAAGGMFLVRGVSGHCHLYESLGLSTTPSRSGVPDRTGIKIDKGIFIARPAGELYRFWRNLENLPEFMEHIESVRILDDRRSHWTVKGPGGQRLEWDAEIVNEHPGEMISWQTLPGADVQSAGTVRFTPSGEGTRLRVVLEFHPPGGVMGARIARFFGKDPELQLDQDLFRLKQIAETRTALSTQQAGS
jgi:uncharacterized membrane protein